MIKEIRIARKNRGFTQEELAYKLDITSSYYRRIEKGKSIPTVKIALCLCKILEINIYDIEHWNNQIPRMESN